MDFVTRIPFSDIILAIGSVSLIIALLWAGFFPKKSNESNKSTTTKSSSASKPASTGININISNGAGGGSSNAGQEPKA